MERDFKWVWISREIWLSTELTLQEKVFFVEIDSLDNENGCYANNEYFAKFFGLSKSRVSEVINSLEKKWFIKIQIDQNQGNKRIITVEGSSPKPKRVWAKAEEGYPPKPKHNNIINNNTLNNNNNNICEFESFWLIYKRKIDKGRAEKSFNRLTAQEKILAAGGAKKWAQYWDADKTDLQYIPHPTTWLNNKRWQVEPPKATKKAPANAYQDQPEGFLEGFTR